MLIVYIQWYPCSWLWLPNYLWNLKKCFGFSKFLFVFKLYASYVSLPIDILGGIYCKHFKLYTTLPKCCIVSNNVMVWHIHWMNIGMEPYRGKQLAESRCRICLARPNNWLNQYLSTNIDGSYFISHKMLFRMHNMFVFQYYVYTKTWRFWRYKKKTLVSFQMIKK